MAARQILRSKNRFLTGMSKAKSARRQDAGSGNVETEAICLLPDAGLKAGIGKFSNVFRNGMLGRGCVLSSKTIQSGQNVLPCVLCSPFRNGMPTAGAVRSVCQSGGRSGREGVDVHVAFLKEAFPTAWTERDGGYRLLGAGRGHTIIVVLNG